MKLRSINLNLLPVLHALLTEGSVSAAATRLAMSQSAASEALGRLRDLLDDQLLVRTGGRRALTPHATALIEPLADICQRLDLFFMQTPFDPAAATGNFAISTSDYVVNLLAPRLIPLLRTEAPGLTVRFRNVRDSLAADLATREVDLAIIPDFFVEDLVSLPTHFQVLFTDHTVVVLDAHHPLAARSNLSIDDLLPYRLIAFHPGSAAVERKRHLTFISDANFTIAAMVPEVSIIPDLVRDSLDFGIVPGAFANGGARYSGIVARPFTIPHPLLRIGMAWNRVHDRDEAHRWMRQAICNAMGAVGTAPEVTLRR